MASFELKFSSVLSDTREKINKFELYLTEVEQAVEVRESLEDCEEEIWDQIALNAEQDRDQ